MGSTPITSSAGRIDLVPTKAHNLVPVGCNTDSRYHFEVRLLGYVGMLLIVGTLRLTFPDDLPLETYECPDYNGVIFVVDGVKYDVVNNKALGMRLLISEGLGWLKDLPLHLKTLGFLPDVIRVEHVPVV